MEESEKTSLFDGKGDRGQRRQALRVAQEFLPANSRKMAQQALDGPNALFDGLEPALLREARQGAHNSGKLVAFSHRDDGGRKITTFEGDPRAWMEPFMQKGGKVRINRDVGTHEETVRVRDGQRVRVE